MRIFCKTDTGLVRTTNQDSYFAGEIADSAVFAVVCDGMGGANAGNIASEAAVKRIYEYVINSYRRNMTEDDIEKLLKNAVVSANIELYDMSVNDPALSGMGTTAVLVLIQNRRAVLAHVGDSRIYLVNDGIKQLTRDHSVVQSLIESGKITPEDAKVHPRKNVITRAIGAEEDVAVDTGSLSLTPGDTLMLCSDGLTNYLETEDILNIFKNTDIEKIPSALVEAANAGGGGDNITVVTVTE